MFSWQEQYLTSERSERVRYCSCHSNIKFISSRHRVISSIYFGWEIQLRGNFWQGPFSKDALLENGTKSHNFTNLFFCDVTLRYSKAFSEIRLFLENHSLQFHKIWQENTLRKKVTGVGKKNIER